MAIEINPDVAQARQAVGALLIDVRDEYELASGVAKNARAIPLAALIADPGAYIANQDAEVLLICQSGRRSMHGASVLSACGYHNVASVSGGTTRWIAEGLPVSSPSAEMDADFSERYARHLTLAEIGSAGQRALEAARVLIVGAGGLGSPAALYLAAAGIGMLRLADNDVVDRSNLQRQVLHTDSRVGIAKVESAILTLSALNPRTHIEAIEERVTSINVEQLLDDIDVVIDGADNFATRYLLNDACVKLGKPLVYGAVHRFEGQVSVFDAGRQRGVAPCYRCLFPEPPTGEAAPNCAEAGVLGVLPGVIGLLQATEAIKLVLGVGNSLTGRLLQFDALSMRFHEIQLSPDPDCAVCAPGKSFPGYIDYAAFCRGYDLRHR